LTPEKQRQADVFDAHVPVLEEMYGWSSDDNDSEKIDDFYREAATQIILVDDQQAGFLSLLRRGMHTDIQCLFLRPAYQRRGIGTQILQGIMAQATVDGIILTIGTHRINPAKRLYERLGFVAVRESKYRVEFAYPKEASA
jgi:GNAT superfamily N-acetyltransferase